jgi:hypothetical protein
VATVLRWGHLGNPLDRVGLAFVEKAFRVSLYILCFLRGWGAKSKCDKVHWTKPLRGNLEARPTESKFVEFLISDLANVRNHLFLV